MATSSVILVDRNTTIHRAEEDQAAPTTPYLPRDSERRMMQVGWDTDNIRPGDKIEATHQFDNSVTQSIHLIGPEGVGRRQIVYKVAESLNLPVYSLVGHSQMTPQDLVVAVVPAENSPRRQGHFVLRASPLTTAFLCGGICHFERINRVPSGALSPLASLLDSRHALFSTVTQSWLRADLQLREHPFLFCCSTDNECELELPGFIDHRIGVRIHVGPFELGNSKYVGEVLAEIARMRPLKRPPIPSCRVRPTGNVLAAMAERAALLQQALEAVGLSSTSGTTLLKKSGLMANRWNSQEELNTKGT